MLFFSAVERDLDFFKPAEWNPFKNLSLTFRNPTFSINRKQNTVFSHRSCDGSIAIQNEQPVGGRDIRGSIKTSAYIFQNIIAAKASEK